MQNKVNTRGATRMARGGIRLVLGLTKSTLITYFVGIKINPKYAFLRAFFLICLSCPFPNLSIWPKTHLFSNFTHFCTPKWCTRVHCRVLKNNPNYMNFWMSLIPPLTFECPPPPRSIKSIECTGASIWMNRDILTFFFLIHCTSSLVLWWERKNKWSTDPQKL